MIPAIDARFDLDLPTPFLAVDLDVLEANSRRLAEHAHRVGVRYLPHAKTHRIPELGVLQIACGADGLCVATITEAEAFAAAGVREIFIAYPVVDRHAVERILRLAESCTLTVGVDSVAGAQALAAPFAAAGRELDVLLAVDAGYGREGVAPPDAVDLGRAIHAVAGLNFRGLYTHEGTTYQARDHEHLAQLCREALDVLLTVAAQLRADGIDCPVISMGASASALVMAELPGVTEIRPGINAFNDVGQLALGHSDLDGTAARVIATVVSLPEPGRGCLNAGSKTLGKDAVPAAAHSADYPGFGLLVNAPGWQLSALSEEHGWLRHRPGSAPETQAPLQVGDRIEIVPNHVCVAFSASRRAHLVRGGKLVGTADVIPVT